MRQFARTQRGVLGLDERIAHRTAHAISHARERDVAKDDREHVIKIVGDAAGQQADGFEPARLLQFRLGSQSFGNIAEDQNRTDDVVGMIDDGREGLRNVALAGGPAHENGVPGRWRRLAGKHATQQFRVRFAIIRSLRAKHLVQRTAHGQCRRPARKPLGHLIEQDDASAYVGRLATA